MKKLKAQELKNYFARPQTVSQWWLPDDGKYNFHYEQEIKILDEQFPVQSNWRVLDAGCGKGRFSIWFAKKAYQVLAVDISREMLTITQGEARKAKVSNMDFVACDIENAPLKERKFDVVNCMEVIDHLDDLTKGIASLVRTLNNHGFLIITFTAANSIYGIFRAIFTFFAYLIKGKTVDVSNNYTLPQIEKILKKNNLKIEKVFGVGLLSFPQERIKIPAFLNWLLYKMSRWDIQNRPYYSNSLLAPRCSSVVVISSKKDSA